MTWTDWLTLYGAGAAFTTFVQFIIHRVEGHIPWFMWIITPLIWPFVLGLIIAAAVL